APAPRPSAPSGTDSGPAAPSAATAVPPPAPARRLPQSRAPTRLPSARASPAGRPAPGPRPAAPRPGARSLAPLRVPVGGALRRGTAPPRGPGLHRGSAAWGRASPGRGAAGSREGLKGSGETGATTPERATPFLGSRRSMAWAGGRWEALHRPGVGPGRGGKPTCRFRPRSALDQALEQRGDSALIVDKPLRRGPRSL